MSRPRTVGITSTDTAPPQGGSAHPRVTVPHHRRDRLGGGIALARSDRAAARGDRDETGEAMTVQRTTSRHHTPTTHRSRVTPVRPPPLQHGQPRRHPGRGRTHQRGDVFSLPVQASTGLGDHRRPQRDEPCSSHRIACPQNVGTRNTDRPCLPPCRSRHPTRCGRAGVQLLDTLDDTTAVSTTLWQSSNGSSPPSSKKQSPRATSSRTTIPKTSPKCWWRCRSNPPNQRSQPTRALPR